MSLDHGAEADLKSRALINGVEIAWDEWGPRTGSPLVLAHGFSGGAHDFALQIPALSRSRRVIAFDHRGHGMSTKTRKLEGYTIDQLVADLTSFLETVADRPVNLLGHSMGGRVALGVVLARPDLIGSLILMDTTASRFELSNSRREQAIAAFFAGLDPAAGVPDMTMRGPEELLIEKSTPSAWRNRKNEFTAGLDPFAIKALGTALFAGEVESVEPLLGQIHCPVTVIVGSEDHPFVDHAPALIAGISGAALVVIDGAYHSPQLTHADQWLRVVEAHLASLD